MCGGHGNRDRIDRKLGLNTSTFGRKVQRQFEGHHSLHFCFRSCNQQQGWNLGNLTEWGRNLLPFGRKLDARGHSLSERHRLMAP